MNSTRRRLLWWAGLFPILFFCFIVVRYSVNVPWFDDFDPFPDFLRKWLLSDGFIEKVQLLFQPNNEHRMVFGKGIMVLFYSLTGKLNFTFLHLAGVLFTLGTLGIFWKSFRTTHLPLYLFLPVPFLLFQLQYHLIFLWAICSLQHQPVVFFVVLSMFFLSRRQVGWGILAAFCASFAMSNGIFVWVGGAAILFFQVRYRSLALWCISGAAAIVLYFWGMDTLNNESSLGFFLENSHLSFLGFFAFLGGLFDLFPDRSIQVRTFLPIVMGMAVIVWVVIWLWSYLLPWLRLTFGWSKPLPGWMSRLQAQEQSKRTELGYFCLGVMIFLLANAGVIALLRPRFGFFVMVVSNYKIYPALFLIVSYLSFIASTKGVVQQRGFRIGIITSLTIWALTLIHYWPTLSERRKYLLANAYNQQQNAFGLGHVPGSPSAVYTDSLMKFMTRRGIYTYPREFDPFAQAMLSTQELMADSLQFKLTKLPKGLWISQPTVEIPAGYNTGAYAFLRKENRVYIFKISQRAYTGRNLLIHYEKGLETFIPYVALPSGTYEWGVVLRNGQHGDSAATKPQLVGTVTIP